jgi:hypothetical protein
MLCGAPAGPEEQVLNFVHKLAMSIARPIVSWHKVTFR